MINAKKVEMSSSLPVGSCRRFSFSEIESATENFDEANLIGKGGFGNVYEGRVHDGMKEITVAVKRAKPNSNGTADQFRREIELLSKFKHSHLISLIGYCDESPELIIVYEFMPNGSLADHLNRRTNTSSLTWEQLLRICIGAARGLDYLHTGTGPYEKVIHSDVKSANILLDSNLEAKISDLGLSTIGPSNQPCSEIDIGVVRGTRGYIAPEYMNSRKQTRKVDVYAFGVVLLEVLCGRKAWGSGFDTNPYQWFQQFIREQTLNDITHPSVKSSIVPTCLQDFADLSSKCLHDDPKKRPTMSTVVANLESTLALQEGTYPSPTTIYTDQEFSEIFHAGAAMKVVRLRSHDGKYLHADDNEESVSQDRNRSAENTLWTVEYVGSENLIRLKSCYNKYLTTSNEPVLLGMPGKKVLQTLPLCLDFSDIEWELIREGYEDYQVKLKNPYGRFLRALGGLPPYRNMVTHDISYKTHDWMLWDVHVVESLKS